MSKKRPSAIFAAALVLLLAGHAFALDVAAPYVHADYMWGRGYTGSGVEIGVIDLYYADGTHPAIDGNYLGRVKYGKGAEFISAHATAVTGTAASQDASYTGVASSAGWWTGQTANPAGLSSYPVQTSAAESFARGLGIVGDPVEVITLSIGMTEATNDTSGTDHWSLGLDHVINQNAATITVAAGNDGPGSATLSGLPTGAYNVILVGATGDTGGSPSEDYTRMASYSSRGPTSDGRAKPDIVAPGSYMHVPVLSGGWGEGDGTSFATPMVAGGAATLIGMGGDLGYSTDPRVIKSVLLNSADKLSGWSNTPTAPLDLNQGAGQMNLMHAYLQYVPGEQVPGTVGNTGWDTAEISYGAENTYDIDLDLPAGAIITATLAWNRIVDASSEATTKLEKITYSFNHMDNLELFIYDADNPTVPLASSVSTIDNVEHIHFTAPSLGRYVIGVKMSGASPGDLETYALSWRVDPSGAVLPGDANVDGVVDGQDFTHLKGKFGEAGNWFQGDFNDDGLIDGQDFTVLKAYFGEGTLLSGTPVPEPAGASLLALCALGLIRRRSR